VPCVIHGHVCAVVVFLYFCLCLCGSESLNEFGVIPEELNMNFSIMHAHLNKFIHKRMKAYLHICMLHKEILKHTYLQNQLAWPLDE